MQPKNKIFDYELQHLIDLSGLEEQYIAGELGITAEYLSLIKYGARSAVRSRQIIKCWLINFIRHYLKLKFAA